jgi:hypothetical protein
MGNRLQRVPKARLAVSTGAASCHFLVGVVPWIQWRVMGIFRAGRREAGQGQCLALILPASMPYFLIL